jgi:hypothetical protein
MRLPSFSIPYPTLTIRSSPSGRPLRRRNYAPLMSVFRAAGTLLLLLLSVLAIAVAAAWEFLQGFVQGFRDARTLLPPPAPAPAPRAKVLREYEVVCNQDSEVLLNGVPIGHIDSGPWQFCSYTEPPAPARESKARAFDDACDYAEAIVRQA